MKSHQIVSISPASDDLSQPIDDYHAITIPKPTAALSREAKNWWREIVTEYGIADSGGLLLLRTALEALDRMRQAQKAIKTDGAVVRDRFGQPKPHPLLTIERDSRAAMIGALRALNLDVLPLHDRAGRPGGT